MGDDVGMAERMFRWLAFTALAVSLVAFLSVDRQEGWPKPDAPSYVQLADGLARGDGYSVDIPGELEGSRYPPGFPMLLALLSPVADASTATVLLAGAFVVAVWASAWKAGGPIGAAVAVLMLALYLPRHQFAGAVMADITGALFVVLPLLALQHGRERLAGMLAGLSGWVKLVSVVVAAGLPRRSLPPFAATVAALGVTKLAWGWGYRSADAGWSLTHVFSTSELVSPQAESFPNVLAYPLMILGLTGSLTAPGAALLAAWAVWRRPERRFALGLVAGLVAVYLPYFYQASRFMFPVVAVVAIYFGCAIADLVGHSRQRQLPHLVVRGGAEIHRDHPDLAVQPE